MIECGASINMKMAYYQGGHTGMDDWLGVPGEDFIMWT